jgi:hypothetical protein
VTVRIAKVLRVVKNGTAAARLEIDGELFEFATVDGFTVHPQRNQMPSVTLTIAANRVELVDDMDTTETDEKP